MERSDIKESGAKSDPTSVETLTQFSVARPDRVADQVYRHLRQAILSEQIAAGTRLRETEIAAALKVSRTPVREAISRLIGDWLVRELDSGGVEVIDAMSEAADIYHIREALELCAARLAAKRITPVQLAKLDGLVKEARTASFKERVRINQQFHMTIAEAAGSPRLLGMISGFREYFLNRHWISRQNTAMAKRAQEDHKKIVVALKSGSAEKVERVLRSHLKLGWEELIAHAKSSG
jgi:DNA-binding GntR family transcriptional regulator